MRSAVWRSSTSGSTQSKGRRARPYAFGSRTGPHPVSLDLFEANRQAQIASRAPLATRMRPRSLDELVGQEAVVGQGTLLRRAIEADRLSSLILWGPPGSGKTTLAQIVAATTK